MVFTSTSIKYLRAVKTVFRTGNIFKIPNSIVGGISIPVIDYITIWTTPQECSGNKLMNPPLSRFSVFIKFNPLVSVLLKAWRHCMTTPLSIKSIFPSNAPHIAHTADLVISLIVEYILPNFLHLEPQYKTPLAVAQCATNEFARGVSNLIIGLSTSNNKLIGSKGDYTTRGVSWHVAL